MHTITRHIVIADAAAAAVWYTQILGAEERVDALWKRAVDAGAEVRQLLRDVFWGELQVSRWREAAPHCLASVTPGRLLAPTERFAS
jgi:uncharacterized glyoxalase superfamily protein PhnB